MGVSDPLEFNFKYWMFHLNSTQSWVNRIYRLTDILTKRQQHAHLPNEATLLSQQSN